MKTVVKYAVLAIVVVLLAVLVFYSIGIVQYTLEHRSRSISAQNIRSIIAGAVEEAARREGRFPETDEGWAEMLVSEGFVPAESFIHPRGEPYGYILVAGGQDDFDPEHIVVCEHPDANAHHTLIGYADGHVDLVEQHLALQRIKELTNSFAAEEAAP